MLTFITSVETDGPCVRERERQEQEVLPQEEERTCRSCWLSVCVWAVRSVFCSWYASSWRVCDDLSSERKSSSSSSSSAGISESSCSSSTLLSSSSLNASEGISLSSLNSSSSSPVLCSVMKVCSSSGDCGVSVKLNHQTPAADYGLMVSSIIRADGPITGFLHIFHFKTPYFSKLKFPNLSVDFQMIFNINGSYSTIFSFIFGIYVTLEHKTSHKGQFFSKSEIFTSSESWINNISIDVWFVMIGQYLKIWNLRVQKNQNIEKITFKVVQM